VKRLVVGALQDTLSNNGGERKAEQYDHNAHECKEQRLEVVPQIAEHEHHREHRKCNVSIYQVLEYSLVKHLVQDVCLKPCQVVAVNLFNFVVKVDQDFIDVLVLLLEPVGLVFVPYSIDLDGSTQVYEASHEVDSQICDRNLTIKELAHSAPYLRSFNGLVEVKADLLLGVLFEPRCVQPCHLKGKQGTHDCILGARLVVDTLREAEHFPVFMLG